MTPRCLLEHWLWCHLLRCREERRRFSGAAVAVGEMELRVCFWTCELTHSGRAQEIGTRQSSTQVTFRAKGVGKINQICLDLELKRRG